MSVPLRLIGVVHLPALPGSPGSQLSLAECVERAVADAHALETGGVDAVLVENFNDVPFRAERVDAHTVATMTACCLRVREAVNCALGVNVLRNDAAAALGIAVACEASFVRVNVHVGAMLTDQGIIHGRADETLRLRRQLGAEHVRIFADVLVKHAVALGPLGMAQAVSDTVERGLADAVIVSGVATGAPAKPHDVRVAAAASAAPVYIGSGINAGNVASFVPPATGCIVGSALKIDGHAAQPVDAARVRALRNALDIAVVVQGG
jgi:membrane complex biogenesis BtpA family protein